MSTLNLSTVMLVYRPPVFRGLALEVLESVAALNVKPIEGQTLPLLVAQLPSSAPKLEDEAVRYQLRQNLHALSVLCAQPGLLEYLLIRIFGQLETLISTSASSSSESDGSAKYIQRECDIAYAHTLLHTIHDTISRKVAAKHHDIVKHFDALVPRLFGIFKAASATPGNILNDVRVVVEASAIIELMTQRLETRSVPCEPSHRSPLTCLFLVDKPPSLVTSSQRWYQIGMPCKWMQARKTQTNMSFRR